MKISRGVLAGLVAWLAVAGLGSALVWAVISRAGEEVVVSGAPTTTASPRAGAETTRTTPSPSPTRRTTTSAPSPTTSTSPRPASPTSSPTPEAPAPSAPPARQERTWQGQGGTVVVSCEGSTAALVAAQADSGFTVEVRDRGPDRVEVELEGQGSREGAETRVRATCPAGTPELEVDVDPD